MHTINNDALTCLILHVFDFWCVARTTVRTCPRTRSVFVCKQTMSSASSALAQAHYEDWIEARFESLVLWRKLVEECETLNAPSCSFEKCLRADEPPLKKSRVVTDRHDDGSTDDDSSESSLLFESEEEQSNDIVMVGEHDTIPNPCVGTGIKWVLDSDDELVWVRS